MPKKVSKSEKLDFLVREIGKINKELKLLNLQHAQVIAALGKLARNASSKPAANKAQPGTKLSAPAKTPGKTKASPARPVLVDEKETGQSASKLAS